MDPDEIEPVRLRDPASPDLPAPSGRGAIPGASQDLGNASDVVTAIAAAIISTSVMTHSIIITVIVAISVVVAALALGVSGFAVQRTAKDLGDGFHGEAFPAASWGKTNKCYIGTVSVPSGTASAQRSSFQERKSPPNPGRFTAVSIMSSKGVPIQDISDAVGHKSTHVTGTVYRHVIVPAIRGGATVMDDIFDNDNDNDDAQTA